MFLSYSHANVNKAVQPGVNMKKVCAQGIIVGGNASRQTGCRFVLTAAARAVSFALASVCAGYRCLWSSASDSRVEVPMSLCLLL